MDIVEDATIMYGFNKIKPRMPQLVTVGGVSPKESFVDLVREIMVGEGFQEVITFTMSNPENLFTKMNSKREKIVEVTNPKSLTYTCLRNWVIPSLMETLSNNTHVEYPQRIFEVSDCVTVGRGETRTQTSTNLACLSTHARANFSEVKAVLDTLLLNLGLKYKVTEARHASFIDGRVGNVIVNRKKMGVLGEINPRVLEMWGLENPIAAFEISLNEFLPQK
jgi:phenylalanyl-tRNA synthetase beta chain